MSTETENTSAPLLTNSQKVEEFVEETTSKISMDTGTEKTSAPLLTSSQKIEEIAEESASKMSTDTENTSVPLLTSSQKIEEIAEETASKMSTDTENTSAPLLTSSQKVEEIVQETTSVSNGDTRHEEVMKNVDKIKDELSEQFADFVKEEEEVVKKESEISDLEMKNESTKEEKEKIKSIVETKTMNESTAAEDIICKDKKTTDVKVTSEEQESKKTQYKDNLPEGVASHEKDEIDEHFDNYPWVLGALGRLFNFSSGYGPKFAPIGIPLNRRFQTFAVLFWMTTFLFMGVSSHMILMYLFFFTKYWWISLSYFTWYLGDRTICNRGGRRWNWVRRWSLWKHYRDFFPIHLIKTAELDPSKNYIMGYHPHGVLSAGAFSHFATEGTGFSKTFPGFTPYLLTLEGHFHLPFYREFFMATGAVSATKESMDFLLGREGTGRALSLVVGGAKESLDCHPGQVILHLSKRKGFCKMALRHGASLVPMFSFGENDIYDQVANPEGSLIRKIQNAVQQFIGLAPCIFIGRGVFQYSFGIVPFRKPIYTVVGSPIDVPFVQNPTKEQIVNLHETYVNAVIDLYNKYKDRYSENPDVKITIV